MALRVVIVDSGVSAERLTIDSRDLCDAKWLFANRRIALVSRSTTEIQPAQLTRDQIERGIRRIEKRLEEVRKLDPNSLDRQDPYATLRPLTTSIDTAIVDTFGVGTVEHKRYLSAAYFNWPIRMGGGIPHSEKVAHVAKDRLKSIQLLESAIAQLREKLEDMDDTPTAAPVSSGVSSRKVFIVHGHDDGMKEGVARFLASIGFDPIILHEQANRGRTIIQKFREEAQDVGFAVVLLSPDDETTEGQRRARQNVILELGFFLGALGPDRVAALKKGDVETPSDFDGVIYTAYEGSWKAALATELQATGYEIDWNKVMRP